MIGRVAGTTSYGGNDISLDELIDPRLPIKLLFCVVWSKPSKAFAAMEIIVVPLIEIPGYATRK